MNIDELLGGSGATTSEETVSATTIPEEKAEVLPVEKETKPKKKKGKPRGGNSPVIGMNGYDLEPGDNTKFLMVQMELFNMPNIDLENVEEVQQRLSDYFALYARNDMKPTVAGMALALNGHSRQWLWAVCNNQPVNGQGDMCALPPATSDAIKKARFLLENLWESYMSSGKVNPVAGIFLGKNNFGYQDKTEYVLTPNTNTDNDYSADEIRERYIAADQQKRLTTINSDEDQND